MDKKRITGAKISVLKAKLRNTDYQAIKFAEGELSEEEYVPIREQRRAWRVEINALEAEIAELRNNNTKEETTNED
jgi:hypothetical protein